MDFDTWLRIEYMLIINEIFEENTTNFVYDKWEEKRKKLFPMKSCKMFVDIIFLSTDRSC